MNTGSPLYGAGGVDNKPPIVFWVYSAVFRVFGAYRIDAVHAFKVLVVLATAAVVGLLAKRLARARAGWVAAILYVTFTAAGYDRMAAANTEVLMMLPATLSVWLLLEGRWAWSGAVLAVAVLTKQVAVLQLALYPAAVLLAGHPPRRLLAAAAGFAAGLAALLLLLAATGSLGGFWHWAVLSLVTGYGPSAWTGGQLGDNFLTGVLPWIGATPLLVWPVVVRLWRPPVQDEVIIRAWLVISVLGVVAGGHFFGHYFIQLVGPLAVLAGVALSGWRWWPERRLLAGAVVALLAMPAVVATFHDYFINAGYPEDPVSVYLAAHTGPDDRIFVWGDTAAVYLYSERVPASRFPGFLRGFPRYTGQPPLNWDTMPEVWPLLAQDLRAHPPLYIADASTANWASFGSYPMSRFPLLPEIVARSYRKVAVVDGVTIYRLR